MSDQEEAYDRKMHYLPYKGASYNEGYKQGLKLLLLGDSFYGETWSRTAPTEAVLHNVEYGEYKFFNNLQRLVTGKTPISADDRQGFWKRVAFTNLIQEPLDKATAIPSKQHWRKAWAAFLEIIQYTIPDLIFFFSRRGWDVEQHFDSPFEDGKAVDLWPPVGKESSAYLRNFSALRPGYQALSGSFHHPSAVRDPGHWDEWPKWADRLLDAAPAILGHTGAKSTP